MQTDTRNLFEYNGWRLTKVKDFGKLKSFDCGKDDLNDFFRNDVFLQRQELLNETYEIIEATEGSDIPVALISLCNDSMQIFGMISAFIPCAIVPFVVLYLTTIDCRSPKCLGI